MTGIFRGLRGPITIAGLIVAGTVACASAARTHAVTPANEPVTNAYSARAPQLFRVRMGTSQGVVIVTVHRDWAPIGADRFYYLVQHGLLDGERFFRVRANFIAQFGLNGDPAVIAAWKGRTIPDDSVRTSNLRGTLAYAMTGRNTRTTQIYFNLADNRRLDSQGFAPFGVVTSGMDAVDRLYSGYDESAGGGVRAGKQGLIESGGNDYLTRHFPKLDYIAHAVIMKP